MIIRKKIVVEETITTIITEERYFPLIIDEIKFRRAQIKNYIKKHPEFLTSLEPLTVSEDSPGIIKEMARASKLFEVGPMATVAGAIGYYAVKKVVDEGGKHIVFDNGGDISMFLEDEITIGIYTGRKETEGYGIKFGPTEDIISVSSSSGKIGHSFSFGNADVVSVISKNPFLSDAAATAICNKIKERDGGVLKAVIEENLKEGIDGILIMIDNLVGVSEGFPELIRVDHDYNLITRD